MAKKPGAPKRRNSSDDAELRCWSRAFNCGADYLGELKPLGLGLEKRDYRDAEFMAAARDAWRRLGRRWFDACPQWRSGPWAAWEFGAPRGMVLSDFGIGKEEPE